MPPRPRQITGAEWDDNKDAILSLRRSGATLSGIRAEMERVHQFTASYAQYEIQFKKWGERKNLSAEEWRQIFQILDQCLEEKKTCAVYKDRQLIPPFRLKKKRNQYCKGHEYAKRREVRGPLPECIEIKRLGTRNNLLTSVTSGLPITIGTPTLVAPRSSPDPVGDFAIDNLDPNSQMQRSNQGIHAHGSPIGNLAAPFSGPREYAFPPLEATNDFLTDAPSSDTDLLIPMSQLTPLFPAPEPAGEISLSPVTSFDEIDFLAISNPSLAGNMPLSRDVTPLGTVSDLDMGGGWNLSSLIRDDQELQGDWSLSLQHGMTDQSVLLNNQSHFLPLGSAGEFSSKSLRPFFTHTLSLLLSSGSPTTGNTVLRTDATSSSLSSLLPADSTSSLSLLESRMAAQKHVFGSSFYRTLIFSIENNFAGLGDVSIGAVVNFMQQDPQMRSQVLRYLRMTPKIVSKVLVENIIRAAIENNDALAVKEYLETRFVNPNEIVCLVEGEQYTAVERSAMLGSVEVTKALLLAGADAEKTFPTRCRTRGALELAIHQTWRGPAVNMHMMDTLLDFGARVCVGTVDRVVSIRGDPNLIIALMSRISPFEHSDFIRHPQFMVDIVKSIDCDLATKIIKGLFEMCSHTSCGDCAQSNPKNLGDSLLYAAKRGFFKLVTFLLDYTTGDGAQLASAIHSGRKDIIDFLLCRVIDIDIPACNIGEPELTTPLAEAIRTDNVGLIHDLERRGALFQITEESRFRAAIYAASESGNITYVRRLLKIAPHMNGDILTLALSVSIKEAHEEVALDLLEAGAEVNQYTVSWGNPGPPLHEALIQRNKRLVFKIMDCDVDVCEHWRNSRDPNPFVEAAVQWGDLSVIKDLMLMHAFSDDEVMKTAILASVRAKNKPLIVLFVKEHGFPLSFPEISSQSLPHSPLAIAVSSGDIDMVQYLLSLGADPACTKAFNQAAFTEEAIDRVEILAALLRAFRAKYPLGKEGFGSEVLKDALYYENFVLVDILLEAKFDVNSWRRRLRRGLDSSVFGMAIKKLGGLRLDIIRRLMAAGSDPNGITSTVSAEVESINIRWRRSVRNSQRSYVEGTVWSRNGDRGTWSQQTALLQAIGTTSKALVELLIDSGADFKLAARLRIKRTPLQYACQVGAYDIVDLLLRKGVSVNEAPALRGGATSLQLSAIGGYCKIAQKLLDCGADLHAAPAELDGRTALEGAAEHGRLHMLLCLWDASDRRRYSPQQCTSAMELAKENGHVACCDLLLELSSAGQGFVMSEPFDR